MQKPWDITQDAFDNFLAWLDFDRELAGVKYEDIRTRLITLFTCRGCQAGEDLADETINRVIRKMQQMGDTYTGDPASYFYGVARRVHLEHVRKRPLSLPPASSDSPEQKERQDECLDLCMKSLSSENQNLMLAYYNEDRQARIDLRKKLAAQLGISGTAMRLRVHRIRAGLQSCVESCLRCSLHEEDE